MDGTQRIRGGAGTETGALVRTTDWAKTALGPVEHWPESLVHAVDLVLNSKFPIHLFWGDDSINLYNDSLIPHVGARHPVAFGRPAWECLPEAWHIMEPMFRAVKATGQATMCVDRCFTLTRNGYNEEVYLTWSYSAVLQADGSVGGIFAPIFEKTSRVISDRRVRALGDLGRCSGTARTVEQACTVCADVLAAHTGDTTFALIYQLAADGSALNLRAHANIAANHPAAAPHIAVTGDADGAAGEGDVIAAAARQVLRERRSTVVEDIHTRCGVDFPGGPWPESSRTCVVAPLLLASGVAEEMPLGVIVLGVSPRQQLDEWYQTHLDLVTLQVATVMGAAVSFEAQCRRAEMLAQLDHAKTAFFSNVSHEFRTPLTLIQGPLEEALADKENALPEVQRERLELMQRNTQRLLRLVNALLEYSRVEAGRMRAVFAPADLAQLTANAASSFRSAIEDAGLTLHVECDDLGGGETVYVDAGMWETVLLNLLSNAFKFTLAGRIDVVLRAHPAEHAVTLTVRDTGCGIRAEDLPRLFERFYRADASHGRSFEGTGIGLALTQELVKLHGGRVSVESEFGRGSAFTVWLPTGRDHLPADQVRSDPVPLASPSLAQAVAKVGEDATVAWASSGANQFVHEAMQWITPAVHATPATPADGPAASRSDSSLTSLRLSMNDMDLMPGLPMPGLLGDEDAADDAAAANTEPVRASLSSDTDMQMQMDDGRAHPSDEVLVHWHDDAPTLEILHQPTRVSLTLPLRAPGSPPVRPLVLLVDDNRDMRNYIEAILRRSYEVVPVSDGLAALEYVAHTARLPDVVLSDVMMPRLDGPSLVRRLRQSERMRYVPVILLSARSGEDARVEGLHSGADDYLSKPFSSRELLARVHAQAKIGQMRRHLESLVQTQTRALIESRNLYRTLIVLNPVGVFRCDCQGRPIYATRRFVELIGVENNVTGEAIAGWHAYVHDEDRAKVDGICHEMYANKPNAPQQIEFRLVRPCDGRVVWLAAEGLLEFDADGEVVGMVATMSDITQRKQLEAERLAAVQAAEEASRHRAAEADEHRRKQELFVDMVCHEIRNPLNGIVNCVELMQTNTRSRTQLAHSLPPCATRDFLLELIADDASLLSSIDVCMSHQRKITDDVLNLSKLSSGNLALNPEPSQPSQLCKRIVDMFAAQAHASSVSLVFEGPAPPLESLTVVLDPYRLAQILINLVSNALKFTVGCTRREVRVRVTSSLTPPPSSSGASSTADLAGSSISSPSPLQPQQAQQQQRQQQQRQPLTPISPDANPSTAGALGQYVSASSPTSVASAAGGRSSSVSSSGDPPDSNGPTATVTISVADTGVGMEPREVASLFQRFRQANTRTYSRYGGTGLGLYISKLLVDLLGGQITVESSPGAGAVFEVKLTVPVVPTVDPERDEAAAARNQCELAALSSSIATELRQLKQDMGPTMHSVSLEFVATSLPVVPSTPQPQVQPQPTPQPLADGDMTPAVQLQIDARLQMHSVRKRRRSEATERPVRVLVVDDNEINQRILQRQLHSLTSVRCDTDVASNGLEAVQRVEGRSEPYDAILMDVEMPVMGGLEATRQIRAVERRLGWSRVPIIGISGNARDVHVQAAIDAGMTQYVVKPYTKDVLVALLMACMSEGPVGDGSVVLEPSAADETSM